MNHFEYRNGEMFAESVPLKRIAREVGTPAYVYSLATLKRRLDTYYCRREYTEAHDPGNPFASPKQ